MPTFSQQNLLLSEQPLGNDSMFLAGLDEPVRFDNGTRLRCVFDAHNVVQPRLLSHGVYIDFAAVEKVYNVSGLFVVGSRQAP